MLVGYLRVSTNGDCQVLDLQRDALLAAGVDERHLFEDRATGSRGDRVGRAKVLAFIKTGDCLVVWKLDRLGRSLPHLLATVTDLEKRGVAFRSLTEQMDTTTTQGRVPVPHFRLPRPVRAVADPGAGPGRGCRGCVGGLVGAPELSITSSAHSGLVTELIKIRYDPSGARSH